MSKLTIVIGLIILIMGIWLMIYLGKKLYPLIVKWIYGKYSFNYYRILDTIKKKKIRIPTHNEFLSFFHPLYYNDRIPVFETDEEIKFENINYGAVLSANNKTIKNITKFRVDKFHNHNGLIIADDGRNHLHRESHYFFMDDIFIMGIYRMRKIKLEDCVEIKDDILKKYNVTMDKDLTQFIIKNTKNQFLEFTHNGFGLSVKYHGIDDDKLRDELLTELEMKYNKS